MVYGQYFAAMTIPLVRGRYFSDQDNLHSTSVIIISKSIADRYWPGRDPLGKRLKWGPPESAVPWLTVVGVVGDVKPGALDQPTQPHTYESYAQANDEMTGFLTYMYLAVRTRGDALSQYSAVRRVLAGLDTQLAVADVQTMTDVINKSFEPRRFNLFLLGAFAMVAMLLGGIGIYGVISHSVAQRTHEIGLRIALGATQYDVLRLVVAHGVRLAFVGVGVGLVGALVLTRLLSTLLYEIRPRDPLTLAAVSFLLVAVALAASCVPARRATKVDPIVALRYD